MAKKLTQNEANIVIEKQLKNSKYELYGEFNYQNKYTSVKLKCNEHGEVFSVPFYLIARFHKNTNKIFEDCNGCLCTYRNKKNKHSALTKEICLEKAKKCNGRKEYKKTCGGCYEKAQKDGFINEIWDIIKPKGNRYKRCIYAYIFNNVDGKNYVYIGLTCNVEHRHKEHSGSVNDKKSSVAKFCLEHHVNIVDPVVLTDYVDKNEASKLEGYFLEKYINDGYIPINKIKCGGLGGAYKNNFSFEYCKKIASKYKSRNEFKKKCFSVYYFSEKMGWIESLIPKKCESHTKDEVLNVSKNYKRLRDFRRDYPKLYDAAKRHKWKECFDHMEPYHKTYTLDMVKEKLKEYESLNEFRVKEYCMMNWLRKNNIQLNSIASYKQLAKKKHQPVLKIDCITNEVVEEYRSMSMAFKKNNISKSKMYKLLHNENNEYGGYKWVFKKDYYDYENIK